MIDMNQNISLFIKLITVHTSMFKLSLFRKSLLLTLYVFVILIWTYLSKGNHEGVTMGTVLMALINKTPRYFMTIRNVPKT
jgi:hypothetical protein